MLTPTTKSDETREEFVERAASEGWDGAIFACSSCKGINPAGMLVCLHCSCPFIFRLDAYPDYLIAPMAQKCVRDVVKKGCPNVIVPDPVRFEMLEMARALRYGVWSSKYSLFACIKLILKSYLKWQKKVVP